MEGASPARNVITVELNGEYLKVNAIFGVYGIGSNSDYYEIREGSEMGNMLLSGGVWKFSFGDTRNTWADLSKKRGINTLRANI